MSSDLWMHYQPTSQPTTYNKPPNESNHISTHFLNQFSPFAAKIRNTKSEQPSQSDLFDKVMMVVV